MHSLLNELKTFAQETVHAPLLHLSLNTCLYMRFRSLQDLLFRSRQHLRLEQNTVQLL